jgi:hypothetical protein
MKTYTKISNENFVSMLARAGKLKGLYERWQVRRLNKAYERALLGCIDHTNHAIHANTDLLISDKDYARLMVLASY